MARSVAVVVTAEVAVAVVRLAAVASSLASSLARSVVRSVVRLVAMSLAAAARVVARMVVMVNATRVMATRVAGKQQQQGQWQQRG